MKRESGASSLVLSPRAKQEIYDETRGDLFRRARELEDQLLLDEKGLLDKRQIHVASTGHSPAQSREKIYVHLADADQEIHPDVKRQESIQAKLSMY